MILLLLIEIVTYCGSYRPKGWKGDENMRLLVRNLTMPIYESMTLRMTSICHPHNWKEGYYFYSWNHVCFI